MMMALKKKKTLRRKLKKESIEKNKEK